MKKVNEYLREAREKRGISLATAADDTKIIALYLKALEDGKYDLLPSRAYAAGFIKTYAAYLGLSQEKILAFFRREYGEEIIDVVPTYRKKTQTRFSLKTSTARFVILSVCIVLLYGVVQYSSFFLSPRLIVTFPNNNQVVTDNIVSVSGKTDPSALLTVDHENVYVDIAGNFKKSLYLLPGDKTITVVAKNRFGRQTVKKILVKVE